MPFTHWLQYVHFKLIVFVQEKIRTKLKKEIPPMPGIEPGSTRWERDVIAITLHRNLLKVTHTSDIDNTYHYHVIVKSKNTICKKFDEILFIWENQKKPKQKYVL